MPIANLLVADQPDPVVDGNPSNKRSKCFASTTAHRQFFDVSHRQRLDLIMAAYYLDIPDLIACGSQHIADLIKDKPPREIRQILQQECDLIEADIADIRSHLPLLDTKWTSRKSWLTSAQEPNAEIIDLLATDVSVGACDWAIRMVLTSSRQKPSYP